MGQTDGQSTHCLSQLIHTHTRAQMTISQPMRTGELVPASSCLRSKLFIIIVDNSKHCCAEKEVTLTVGKCVWYAVTWANRNLADILRTNRSLVDVL